jgi:hypothetical protein
MNNPLLMTLDHNCIIALEKDEELNADAIRQLIAFQQKGIIHIVIGWSTMFEKPPQGKKPLWFPEQERRLNSLGLGDVEQFKHPQTMWFSTEEGYLTYQPERSYLRAVHEVLFPTIDFEFQNYLTRYCHQHQLDLALYRDAFYYSNPLTRVYTPPAEWEQRIAREQEFADTTVTMQTLKKIREKWMNAKNDALGLCAHVSWKGDIFVTSDKHFYKVQAQAKLSSLVPGKILPPRDAVQEVDRVIGRGSNVSLG